jgi:hypothetical protein
MLSFSLPDFNTGDSKNFEREDFPCRGAEAYNRFKRAHVPVLPDNPFSLFAGRADHFVGALDRGSSFVSMSILVQQPDRSFTVVVAPDGLTKSALPPGENLTIAIRGSDLRTYNSRTYK